MSKKSIQKSFNYAIEGIINALRTQKNMRIHFLIAFLVMLASLFLEVSRLELVLLFFIICFVLALEMINSAVEIIVDMLADKYSVRAKIAKNTAAGAVLLGAVAAVFAGYLIFVDKLDSLSLQFVPVIKQQPLHLIFINLGLLFTIIIFMKSLARKGTPLAGGMPSGHSALGFSLATMVFFLTDSYTISCLAFLLAFLSAHSRIDSGVHNFLEVVVGSLVGIFITLVIFGLL